MLITMHDGSRVVVRQHADIARVRSTHSQFVVTQSGGGGGGIPYEGEYEVTPLAFTDQTLPTNGKTLRADVFVHDVPYYETSNESGGVTVSIAS